MKIFRECSAMEVRQLWKRTAIGTADLRTFGERGDIEEQMMYNTYNMGLGMIVAVDPADAEKTMQAIKAAGDTPYVVGRIEAGEKGVTLC